MYVSPSSSQASGSALTTAKNLRLRYEYLRWVVTTAVVAIGIVADGYAADAFPHAKQVDSIVMQELKSQHLAGLALAIVEHGTIVYEKGYGYARLDEKIPVNQHTIFNWASISKPLIAVRAMQLLEQGTLDLDVSITRYVPTLPKHLKKVTTRHLLTHQSGIPHYANGTIIGDGKTYTAQDYFDPAKCLGRFINSPLIHLPGERTSYSSYAYILLTAVVQAAGKGPIQQQLDQGILAVLDMDSFTLDTNETNTHAHWAKGYTYDKKTRTIVSTKDWANFWKHGAGGYKSTVGDLARFATGLINDKLLKPKTMTTFTTPQRLNNGKASQFGLGIIVAGSGKQLQLIHNGMQTEARSRLLVWPKRQRALVILCNSQHADPNAITKAIQQAIW